MTTGNLQGPGLLFVISKITRPDLIDEDTFFKWYDDDHIVEILQTSGIQSALRFKKAGGGAEHDDAHAYDNGADKPFLALYPMQDIAFTQTDEFRDIKVCSDMLPHDGPIYDLADFDARYYNLVQVYDPTNKGKGLTKTVVVAQYELGSQLTEDDLSKWYNDEHLDQLAAGASGYLRTTRFKLAYARSNAQSRALKGLLSTTDKPPPRLQLPPSLPPKWLTIHEFESENVDLHSLARLTDTKRGRRVTKCCKVAKQSVFRLVKAHGQAGWFHGVDVKT